MTTWYEITPIDTLFFRGSEPMEAGQLTSTPLFPPPPSVVLGALRTALLRERGVSFQDYKQGRVSEEIHGLIGRCGENAPFSLAAILIKRAGDIYAPAPSSWFVDSDQKLESAGEYTGTSIVTAASNIDAMTRLGIVSSSGTLPLVVARHEACSLAGCWIRLDLLSQKNVTFAERDLLTAGDLFGIENRVGIAIDAGRKVEKGKLYSANHIRLREGVTMLVAVDRDPGLPDAGLFQLGGEQRKSRYERLSSLLLPPEVAQPAGFVTLAPLEAAPAMLPKVMAAYKPVITAGWDLSRGFHKPSITWFSAGTVFSEPVSSSCVAIAL